MAPYRVLIVDDQRDVRFMLRAGLETLGRDIQVTDVPSGEEAILVLSRQPVDLLITDIRLAGITGLELKERAIARNPIMKCVLITGLTDPKIRQTIMDSGVAAYFFKPIVLGELLQVVENLLSEALSTPEVSSQVEPPKSDDKPFKIEPSPVAVVREHSPAARLAGLQEDTGAACVLLIDVHGEIVAQMGEVPAPLEQAKLISAIIMSLGAAATTSSALGNDLPEDWMYFSGYPYDIFLSHVGISFGLLVIMEHAANPVSRLDDLALSMRGAAKDLAEIAAELSARSALMEHVSNVADDAAAAVETVDLPELDAIFAQAQNGKLKPDDADAFWETLVSQDQENLQRPDAISYEQARKLGLTPDEGDDS